MLKLGVNVDHVATVRQARLASYPDPVEAAMICQEAGAHGITAHLREDRRHIQDADMECLKKMATRLNMEMAATEEMIAIASRLQPAHCCLVPEKRQELTTEGGLNVKQTKAVLREATARLTDAGVVVSFFIDPNKNQIEASRECGAEFVELHTGSYANATAQNRETELERLIEAAEFAHEIGLKVNAGHGIDYENIYGILRMPGLDELNIGHSVIARAVIVGIAQAVKEMIDLMSEYPS